MFKFRTAVATYAAIIACVAVYWTPVHAGSYRITKLGEGILPDAINDAGQIVGDAASPGTFFVLSHGTYTTFMVNDPTAQQVHLAALNAKGLVAGSYFSSTAGPSGFTYDIASGQQVILHVDHSRQVTPEAVSRAGTIVGDGSDGKIFIITSSANRLIGKSLPGSMQVSSISNSGTIAGVYGPQHTGAYGFTFKNAVYTTITAPVAGDHIYAMGINTAGVVFGSYGGSSTGFTRIGNMETTFTYPGSLATSLVGVSASGLVIGNYESTAGNGGFVWNGGQYIPLRVDGTKETQILGINGKGDMVGIYYDSHGTGFGFLADCPIARAPCTN